MRGEDFIVGQLALKAWQDGHLEGLSGMRAVAFAIKARVAAGFYGGDWIQVLSHHREWSANPDSYSDELPDPRSRSFTLLLQDISQIFSGAQQNDVTIPADALSSVISIAQRPPEPMYYAYLDGSPVTEWFRINVLERPDLHRRVANVASLNFWT